MNRTSRQLGVGLAAVARPSYITSARRADLGDHRSVDDLRARTWAVLDAAYGAGVRYVDVARSYGRAEEFLAAWLDARPQVDDVLVGSKWGYRYVGGWRVDADVHEVKDHSLAAFTAQLAETEALLGSRLQRYHIHSATPETGVLDDGDLLRALAELRARGVQVGLSTSGVAQSETVRKAIGVRVDGLPLFTSVQSTWNVLEPSAGQALREAADAGAEVIVKEPVANGRLAPGGADPADRPAARVAELAAELGVPVDQLAIAVAIAQPWTWCVLSGAVTPEQVRSNADAASIDVPAAVMLELEELAQDPAEYWTARSARPWA